jgi:hypothetical protein
MHFSIKLLKISPIHQIEGYWAIEDYINLLDLFEYPDAKSIPKEEVFDMLSMAISDFEPNDAAEIILNYKLGNTLNNGQIHNLSHEMVEDKVSEEYPDIALHYPLFNINQLLYSSYNGKFPRILASEIDFQLTFKRDIQVTKEIALRTLSDLLSEKSLLKRLFNDKLDSDNELKDAEGIVWELKTIGENAYKIISSDYWFNREDFQFEAFSGELQEDEIN